MERRLFSLRELSRARCFDLLATLAVGRVGVSVRALPAILPVAYAVAGDRVVFRSAPGAKLDAAVHRSVVAFETDNPADFLDLVQRLRTTESSSYTLRDTPTFTCISTSVERALGALDGTPMRAQLG